MISADRVRGERIGRTSVRKMPGLDGVSGSDTHGREKGEGLISEKGEG
jgi:hypothetical protein